MFLYLTDCKTSTLKGYLPKELENTNPVLNYVEKTLEILEEINISENPDTEENYL